MDMDHFHMTTWDAEDPVSTFLYNAKGTTSNGNLWVQDEMSEGMYTQRPSEISHERSQGENHSSSRKYYKKRTESNIRNANQKTTTKARFGKWQQHRHVTVKLQYEELNITSLKKKLWNDAIQMTWETTYCKQSNRDNTTKMERHLAIPQTYNSASISHGRKYRSQSNAHLWTNTRKKKKNWKEQKPNFGASSKAWTFSKSGAIKHGTNKMEYCLLWLSLHFGPCAHRPSSGVYTSHSTANI